jgi:regulatory protein
MHGVRQVVSIKISRSKAGPALFRIGLSDGSLFSFNPSYLSPAMQEENFYVPGKELSAGEDLDLRFAANCFRAERAALRLIARAEQTLAGLSLKLEQRGHTADCVKAAVSYLEKLEIVSDRRFAERWLQSRLNRGAESPRRLLSSLCQRGIDLRIAREACKSVLNFERETLLLGRYIDKRCPAADRKDRLFKQRLKQEGFSSAALQWYWETGD